MTKEEVLRQADARGVRFVRLQFTDILGTLKNVEIPAEHLEKALDREIMFDGSSIEGFVRIEESDMLLVPDPATFAVFPWKDQEGVTARLICDVYTAGGEPFPGDPRHVLRRAIEAAAREGLAMMAGPECEFFLFPTDAAGQPVLVTHDRAGYFDLAPLDKGEEARADMVTALTAMGFEVEAGHHEVAHGQHEIDFKYTDVLRTADNVATFRFVVRTIAGRHGLHATFMPKPIAGINGSGMHTHQSLYRGGRNAFYDPDGAYQLSATCLHYVGGLLEHARGMAAVTNPLVNSYKRLVPGYEAPVYIAWAERNRSPLVRIPAARGEATRVELRMPDPSCNPYLALAVMLMAGLDGIARRLDPGPPLNRNIYAMTEDELEQLQIRVLPRNLDEAVREMLADPLVCSALGDHIVEHLTRAKRLEWREYVAQVHAWEVNRYLATF
ncbi:MAG: type I glutamate--ammonia ligase [Armatimonadota bacterium]|nr:type I glutamate--ammonia ligase [Armatimonadota bacterium]MDR7550052.1 type I glutamate--ammonia ligase [Armatimonadota bacterium]